MGLDQQLLPYGTPVWGVALGHWTKHPNAIYAAVNTFEQYASPVAPTEDDQSALPENLHESKTDTKE
jgi:hypothetical protein